MSNDRIIAERITQAITGTERRKSGRTTRIVDDLIQDFFNIGVAVCMDHHGSKDMSKKVMDMVIKRLTYEHNYHSSWSVDTQNCIVINTDHPESGEAHSQALSEMYRVRIL